MHPVVDRLIAEHPGLRRLLDQMESGESRIPFWVSTAARSLAVAAVWHVLRRPMVVLTGHRATAEALTADLQAYGAPGRMFPFWETLSYERSAPAPEVVSLRFRALHGLCRGEIAVASVRAALSPVIHPQAEQHLPVEVSVGAEVPLEHLVERLARLGYHREAKVEGRGDLAVRGGIVDVYPPTQDLAVRIEFFGDAIESLRRFEPVSQRSQSSMERVRIFGVREVDLSPAKCERAARLLEPFLPEREWLRPDVERLREGIYFEGAESYLQFLESETSNLLSYLPAEGLIFVEEPALIRTEAHRIYEEESRHFEEAVSAGTVPPPPRHPLASWEELTAASGRQVVEIEPYGSLPQRGDAAGVEASAISLPSAEHERVQALVRGLLDDGHRVFAAAHDGAAERFLEYLRRLDLPADILERHPETAVPVIVGAPAVGFIVPELRLALLSQRDLSGPAKPARAVRPVTPGRAIRSLEELADGDLVVHVFHGIARYRGLKTQTIEGATRDYLTLEYAKGDRLYVPADNLDRLTKFVGGEAPDLSKLGGAEWSRAREKVRRSVRKLAVDLLKLYAHRSATQGHPYSPDSPWQRELEDAFPFEETPDQLRTVEEVKRDMQSPRPMDRLVCGDVGYGKTEVAVRAAFKALTDDKQVLVLAPTTLLAQQHFQTLSRRFEPFPIRVEMLSRFRSPAQQRTIVRQFAVGEIDIVIGTHRLLQRDIAAERLGLIIVDEEQRFGVGHKEQIKDRYRAVDVLTLTATPIPRTLQMSLSGMLDLSVIETPPPKRYPVTTYVGEYDAALVRAAVRRELAREGQIFYVHNRIEDIHLVQRKLAELVPEARIGVAHGRMAEHDLEAVMRDFVQRELDVLLCTTIIESGLDIPAVNTLIVEQAERFGLAQLYQLRGRVGRAHHRAYAYFFVKAGAGLTEAASERLRTIGQLTDLGSGLKLALRDLEIRGAGNLLGAEQHGHVAAVGFELYTQMLEQAVEELQGQPIPEPSDVRIELPLDAFIPAEYIAEEGLRIEAYRQAAEARGSEEAKEVLVALKDRYGPPPAAVQQLLEVCVVKAAAQAAGVTLVNWRRGRLTLSSVELSLAHHRRLRGELGSFQYNRTLHQLTFPRVEAPSAAETAQRALAILAASAEKSEAAG